MTMHEEHGGHDSLTKHARRRMRQRGIAFDAIIAVLDYGRPYHTQDTCTAYLMTKRAVLDARQRGVRLDQHRGKAVVEDPKGRIVTVEHVRRVPRGWEVAR